MSSRSKSPTMMSRSRSSSPQPSGGGNSGSGAVVADNARILQESLHILLSRLARTIEHVKSWPEAKGDDASIHVESTSKLITNINQVIAALQKVEGIVKTDKVLRKSLQECQIPYDLLELLDYSTINPDCFSRGLLREALGQLAGLKRRKLALEMLGHAVQSGLNKRLAAEEEKKLAATSGGGGGGTGTTSKKRPRSSDEVKAADTAAAAEPALKKPHLSKESGKDT